MSTDYNILPPFITSIRLEESPGHVHFHIWINGAKSGVLVTRQGAEKLALLRHLFAEDAGSYTCGALRFRKCLQGTITLATQLLSEYGELTTVTDVVAQSTNKQIHFTL